MDAEQTLAFVDRLVYAKTGKHLSGLQDMIVRKVWLGKKYLEIADEYGCTEGHAKDTGALLWQLLNATLGERINKNNFRSVMQRRSLSEINDFDFEVKRSTITKQGIIESSHFVGRDIAISHLDYLVSQRKKVIVLQGEGGVGKTTLAQQYLSQRNFDLVLEVLMAKETQNIISVESVVEEWLTRDLGEESGNEFGVSLARLKRQLTNRRVGILIDNLEPALDKDGKFIRAYRNYIELLRILAVSGLQSLTLITSRDRLCEADLNLEHYRLPGLELAAWQQFFNSRQLEFTPTTLAAIHQTYGGNAKAMGIVSGTVTEDYDRNLNLYWQENSNDPLVEKDLKNLVASQFNRLQQLDSLAYKLLCRLSCYRFQDIPQLPRAGLLCLMWDIKTQKPQRIINSLRDRSLIEFDAGKYWLHPVVKAEGLSRIQYSLPNNNRSSLAEWQNIHQNIAQFWTTSVQRINQIQDGLIALEAYYHYVAIEDFERAAEVILFSRDNQWGQYLTLGTTLYRLGLLQPLLTAIIKIIDKVKSPRHHSELNNILGDLYWITGKVHQAIDCQQQTIEIANKCLKELTINNNNQHEKYYFRMLEVDSLLSIGLYQIDLWELDLAANFFNRVINLAQNTKHHSWSEKATICLALVKSYLNRSPTTNKLVEPFYQAIIEQENINYNTGRFAYFMQILGQTYLNLNNTLAAKLLFQRAITFSQTGNYTQIQAKSLTGLAIIDRQQHNLKSANKYHQQAINLLEQIGAKCDLAEAYFQFALTLKFESKSSEYQAYMQLANNIFQQIKAPKQIKRIAWQLND